MIWPNDVLSIVMAILLGATIGLERELSGKAAGLRTNVLICMGATIFTIMSRHLAAGAEGESITRIAAQIVTGVGFLGAGAIIQDRGGVHGLTTAATIWLVASVGMACGAEFYRFAFICTIAALAVLLGFMPLTKESDRRLYNRRKDDPK
ncbi:MAG: MgtC/SapB family protein [Sedimentisphaerales bacterium]|nr:MgtC/SapB family protein [Sedimentisphaerales bacterium]